MKTLLVLLCTCLALGLAVVGCGDDDDDSGNGGAAQTAQETEATETEDSTADGGGDAAEVSMRDIQFEPKTVTVSTGGEVTWTNDEAVGHDVTAKDDSFKSGEAGGMSEGDTFTRRFTRAGTFAYVCTVHPGMEGTVRVE